MHTKKRHVLRLFVVVRVLPLFRGLPLGGGLPLFVLLPGLELTVLALAVGVGVFPSLQVFSNARGDLSLYSSRSGQTSVNSAFNRHDSVAPMVETTNNFGQISRT